MCCRVDGYTCFQINYWRVTLKISFQEITQNHSNPQLTDPANDLSVICKCWHGVSYSLVHHSFSKRINTLMSCFSLSYMFIQQTHSSFFTIQWLSMKMYNMSPSSYCAKAKPKYSGNVHCCLVLVVSSGMCIVVSSELRKHSPDRSQVNLVGAGQEVDTCVHYNIFTKSSWKPDWWKQRLRPPQPCGMMSWNAKTKPSKAEGHSTVGRWISAECEEYWSIPGQATDYYTI